MRWPESGVASTELGEAMHRLIEDLYPIPRSITGDGVRETLRRLQELVPITIHEVPSGTSVLDWTVPPEWNVREAWIEAPDGTRIVDFEDSSLHLVGYSRPVKGTFALEEIRSHLHTLPDHPTWTPYRTSYYEKDWGFCLPHRIYEALEDGPYEVLIDSTLEPGSLTYGESVIEGQSADEVLISCHICHPALANDNLSGVSLAVALVRGLLERSDRRYSYRFLFIPGTIGSITWLARNEAVTKRIRHGLVLSGVGHGRRITYKKSRRGDAEIDRVVEYVLRSSSREFEVRPFVPYGYDERQYCSPGYDMPVGCFMRSPWGEYEEYHTSADSPSLVTSEALAHSLEALVRVLDVLEDNTVYRNSMPRGEPQLGRRGLYRATGGDRLPGYEMALLWVLNLSDGSSSLLDIAERSGLDFRVIKMAADALLEADLLEELGHR